MYRHRIKKAKSTEIDSRERENSFKSFCESFHCDLLCLTPCRRHRITQRAILVLLIWEAKYEQRQQHTPWTVNTRNNNNYKKKKNSNTTHSCLFSLLFGVSIIKIINWTQWTVSATFISMVFQILVFEQLNRIVCMFGWLYAHIRWIMNILHYLRPPIFQLICVPLLR